MPCPTCDSTLQKIDVEGRVFWCPRCGTLVENRGYMGKDFFAVEPPKLVSHCQGLLRMASGRNNSIRSAMQVLGIIESIHLPADRPV